MKAFVTGATGFVGSHLVEELIKNEFEVGVLIRNPEKKKLFSGLPVRFVPGSIDNIPLKEIENVDFVFHLAGITKAVRIKEYFSVNVNGTRNICEACAKHARRLKKLVIVSSLAACGPGKGMKPVKGDEGYIPQTPYGKSKFEADRVALSFSEKIPLVILRPGGIYGPRDTDFYQIFKVAKNLGILPHPGLKKKLLNLVYVKDVVKAILLSAEKTLSSGEILLVGDSKNYTWEEVKDVLSEVLGKNLRLLKFPKFLAYPPALFLQGISLITGKPYPLNLSRIPEFLADNWGMEITKTREKLGYAPSFDLKEGLKLTIKWYEERRML